MKWWQLGSIAGLVLGLGACSEQATQELADAALKAGLQAVVTELKNLAQAAAQPATAPEPAADPEAAVLVSGTRAVGQRDFTNAKKVLPRVFRGLEEDFYCGCRYQGKDVDWASCGFVPRKNAERASRIEWEHVVPAWTLGHQRQCWQDGGRKNCAASDPVFRMAEGDLVNLVPAVGEVNGDRSNYPFSAWSRQPEPVYGQCRTVVDFGMKRVQPREEVRGRVARIQFYMHERYGLRMSAQDRQLFCAWSREYPVDGWETERNRRIEAIQGSGNGFVTDPAKLAAVCG